MVKRQLNECAEFSFDLETVHGVLKRLDAAAALGNDAVDASDERQAEAYLKRVATTGQTDLPWQSVRGLFGRRLRAAFDQLVQAANSANDPPEQHGAAKCFSLDESSAASERRAKLSAALDSAEERRAKMSSPNHHIINSSDNRCPKTLLDNVAGLAESLKAFEDAPFTIQRLAELLLEPGRHYKRPDKFYRALEKNLLVVTTVTPEGLRPIEAQIRGAMASMLILEENQQHCPKRVRLSIGTNEQQDAISEDRATETSETCDLTSGDATSDVIRQAQLSPTPEYVEISAPSDEDVTSSKPDDVTANGSGGEASEEEVGADLVSTTTTTTSPTEIHVAQNSDVITSSSVTMTALSVEQDDHKVALVSHESINNGKATNQEQEDAIETTNSGEAVEMKGENVEEDA